MGCAGSSEKDDSYPAPAAGSGNGVNHTATPEVQDPNKFHSVFVPHTTNMVIPGQPNPGRQTCKY